MKNRIYGYNKKKNMKDEDKFSFSKFKNLLKNEIKQDKKIRNKTE